MASDLTERLAAKLAEDVYPSSLWAEKPAHVSFTEIASIAHEWLPLLLSEPELVAGLAPEVKREVLRTLLGERLWELSAAYGVPGDVPMIGATNDVEALLDYLPPSPAPMEGRSNGK